MSISHINGLPLSAYSHINGVPIGLLSHINGVPLDTGTVPAAPTNLQAAIVAAKVAIFEGASNQGYATQKQITFPTNDIFECYNDFEWDGNASDTILCGHTDLINSAQRQWRVQVEFASGQGPQNSVTLALSQNGSSWDYINSVAALPILAWMRFEVRVFYHTGTGDTDFYYRIRTQDAWTLLASVTGPAYVPNVSTSDLVVGSRWDGARDLDGQLFRSYAKNHADDTFYYIFDPTDAPRLGLDVEWTDPRGLAWGPNPNPVSRDQNIIGGIERLVLDNFEGAAGTAITAHTPDISDAAGVWKYTADVAGSAWELDGNGNVRPTANDSSEAGPQIYTGDANLYVITDIKNHTAGSVGIIFRNDNTGKNADWQVRVTPSDTFELREWTGSAWEVRASRTEAGIGTMDGEIGLSLRGTELTCWFNEFGLFYTGATRNQYGKDMGLYADDAAVNNVEFENFLCVSIARPI